MSGRPWPGIVAWEPKPGLVAKPPRSGGEGAGVVLSLGVDGKWAPSDPRGAETALVDFIIRKGKRTAWLRFNSKRGDELHMVGLGTVDAEVHAKRLVHFVRSNQRGEVAFAFRIEVKDRADGEVEPDYLFEWPPQQPTTVKLAKNGVYGTPGGYVGGRFEAEPEWKPSVVTHPLMKLLLGTHAPPLPLPPETLQSKSKAHMDRWVARKLVCWQADIDWIVADPPPLVLDGRGLRGESFIWWRNDFLGRVDRWRQACGWLDPRDPLDSGLWMRAAEQAYRREIGEPEPVLQVPKS